MVSTQTVGSYQATLSIGGIFPVKRVQAVVTPRQSVTVCGTPFGVKMFSEGALIVGFTDLTDDAGAPVNPAKAAGLRLGDRVICIGDTPTEGNDAVKAALAAAAGQAGAGGVRPGRGTARGPAHPLLGCRRRGMAGGACGCGIPLRGWGP